MNLADRKIRLLCLTFLFILAEHLIAFAQPAGFKLYTIKDGLPATSTCTVYQDKYGYLWIGTTAGLSRFDGRQFVNYTVSDGLPSLRISVFFQDSYDRLWTGTDNGISRFKNNRFITYPYSDNASDLYVFTFVETPDKKLWAATGKGVYEFTETFWKKITLFPGHENRGCRGIAKLGNEWYVNYGDDLVYRDGSGKWQYLANSHTFGSIFNVLSLFHGHLYVSIGADIYEIKQHHLVPVFREADRSSNYFSYLVDHNNRLWITHKNYFKISKPNNWAIFTDSVGGFSGPSFVKEDSSHGTWIGSLEGLLKIRPTNFTIIDHDASGPLQGIYNVVPYGKNVLISSGTKNGLQLYDGYQVTPILRPPGRGNENYNVDPIDLYTYDDKGTVWMLSRFARFLKFDGKKLTDSSSVLKLTTHDFIYDMTYSRLRKMLFICADSTLLYGTPQKLSVFIPANTAKPITEPTRVKEVKNGGILIYINHAGIYYIDRSNRLFSLVRETGIDGQKKNDLQGFWYYDEAADGLWISLPGIGLYQYSFRKNGRPFLKYVVTDKNGLQSTNVLSLTTDASDRLWVASNVGIDIVRITPHAGPQVVNYLRQADMSIDVSDIERFARDQSGHIWLSSPKKVIRFDANPAILAASGPRIIIEKVLLDFKETNWQRIASSMYSYFDLPYQPVLKYNQNSLDIFYNAVDVSGILSNPQYSYKLLPVDTAWGIPSRNKSVAFTQLPPGKYTFMARTKDAASGWSKPAVFAFTITPPFWSEWWFRIFVLIVAATTVVWVFTAQIRKIKADSELKNQIKDLEMRALKVQMNPHFIYNALNSIQSLVEQDKKSEGIRYIGSFSRLLRQVLEDSESNTVSLDKELDTIRLYVQLEALRLDVHLNFVQETALEIVQEYEKIPPLILQPFVENALWHGLSRKAGEKMLRVSTALSGERWLVCTITDNGIGREKAGEWKRRLAVIYESKGIEITLKRLIDFNDDIRQPIEFIDLFDEQDQPCGTSVVLYIRRKRA
jgi:ligand-binding sensor domain-containing protein